MAISTNEQQRMPLARIIPHTKNPRRDLGDLSEMVASIKSAGVLEPIVVIERDGKYEAITGSRRLAASKLAGEKDIPVRIMKLDDAAAAAAALIENLQRKDLNAIEEAGAYRDWLDATKSPQKALGVLIGRTPATIAKSLRLLDLNDDGKAAIAAGTIGIEHGLELLRLDDAKFTKAVIAAALKREADDGKPKLLPTIPLRIVAEIVAQANTQNLFEKTLAALPDQLRAEQARLTAEGKVVTWYPQPTQSVYNEEQEKPWRPVTTLGKPPKAIASESYEFVAWRDHVKDCGCNAVAITTARADYDQVARRNPPPVIKVVDVCVDAAKYGTWKRSRNGRQQRAAAGVNNPNRKTKEQREVEARKHAASIIAGTSGYGGPPKMTAKSKRVLTTLSRRNVETEIARVVLYSMTVENFWGGLEKLALWQTIVSMPLAKVRERIVGLAVSRVVPHSREGGFDPGFGKGKKPEPQVEPMLAHYRITMADADLLVKADPAKAKVGPENAPRAKPKRK